jgi:CubicO group peptidase (beta-lactamase class C family)
MSDGQKKIQGILDDHVARGVVGVSLAISMPGKEIAHFTSGLSEKFKKTPMRPDRLFRIASCTRGFPIGRRPPKPTTPIRRFAPK